MRYRVEKESPVIDEDGFLRLDPTPEMNDFDFFLATPTVSDPHRPLAAQEIADAMIETGYSVYFNENRANNIITFQDDQIIECLNSMENALPYGRATAP